MEDLITVTQIGENAFDIEWDGNHPATRMLNNWTEEDFINAIRIGLQELNLEKQDGL